MVVASVFALVAQRIRQPLIIAYIVTGAVVGPSVLGLTTHVEVLQTFSQIGVAFLLFLVGLNLNWRHIKEVGGVALLSGIGQAVVTSGVGFLVARALAFDIVTSLFIGVAFAFSSTIIVVKLLADKQDLDRLYGRISVGLMIVQDLLAMVVLLVIGALQQGETPGALILMALLKTALVAITVWLVSHHLLPRAFRFAAASQELLFLLAIGWCFLVAVVLHLLGFGLEIGALIAGVSLAGTAFHREIEHKVKPLRDFFLVLFFVVLGMNMQFDALVDLSWPIVIFSVFILVGNMLIVLLLMRVLGYHPRIGMLVGMNVAQISEFSFIIIASGVAAGLLDVRVLSFTTAIALVTIGLSAYMITYNESIYGRLAPLFAWLTPHRPRGEERMRATYDILLFGYQDLGEQLYPILRRLKQRILVVDVDPVVIERLAKKRIPHVFGDVGDREFLHYIRAERAHCILSTIPDRQVNEQILSYLHARRSRTLCFLTSKTRQGAQALYRLGATFVIVMSVMSGERMADMMKQTPLDRRRWKRLREKF